MKKLFSCLLIGLFVMLSALAPVLAGEETSVKSTMDEVVTRMYATLDEETRAQLDDEAVLDFLTEEERNVLATRYWYFDANVPVVVSVIRNKSQAVVPFWLKEREFEKTGLTVENLEGWEYEVWQKDFDAGRVELGINGFDKHRPTYFVGVAPQRAEDDLELTNFFPENQAVGEFRKGSLTYPDWTELVLTEVPEELEGQALLSTIRGRAREAHLIGAFRKTPFPSSRKPDHVALTWSEDPRTTQTIQWRTNPEVEDGVVRYRKMNGNGKTDYRTAEATYTLFEDRLLANDRYIHRFTSVLRNLEPGSTYEYTVGSRSEDTWSEEAEFTTVPSEPETFTFVFMSDTHCSPHWGELLRKAFKRHPETAFYTISGDLVGTGLYRDDWDHFFEYSENVFNKRPVVPALGNHDDQDGLGAWMYLDLFGLPTDGPQKTEPERAYSFEYGNALFVILDVTSPIKDQVLWLEKQLSETTATWKFAIFHFPPYSHEEDYPDIRAAWGPLFDKYHVDLVMSGHVHTYQRTKPIRDGEVVDSPSEGTIYLITASVPSRPWKHEGPDYAAATFRGDALYQTFEIDGGKLVSRAYNTDGDVRDEFVIEKP